MTTNGPEELPVPYCTLYVDPNTRTLGRAGAVAAAKSWSGDGVQAYVTQPELQWIATGWELDPSPGWSPWVCFDGLPTPRTISVLRKANSFPEVFVTSAGGSLFVRRQIPGTWLPWQPLNLPHADSNARDVSGLSPTLGRPHVVIADRDGVYLRAKVSADPDSGYGPWRTIGTKLAERIALGVLTDGSLQVFALDRDGRLSFTAQRSPALGADFGEWHDMPNQDEAQLLDIDCGYSETNDLILYAVDERGLLLQRDVSASNGWGIVSDANTPKLLTVAAAVGSTTLIGVSISGVVYRYEPGAAWTPMP